MIRFASLLLALIFALPVHAAVGTKSVQIEVSVDGRLYLRYPDGDAPTESEPLAFVGVAAGVENAGSQDIIVGVPFEHDVRQYLTGTNSATATITIIPNYPRRETAGRGSARWRSTCRAG
jgi:hypothetical protein